MILDTNVVSEFRKVRRGAGDPRVAAWFAAHDFDEMFLSVMTIFEVRLGVLRLRRRDQRQAAVLDDWFVQRLRPAFAGKILPITENIALRCAALHVPDPRGERDAMIAATALVHGYAVATRNVRDFVHMGVEVLNPWDFGR